jgi:hypothetical protein
MHKDNRLEALNELQHAWSEAAFGLADQAKKHMGEALELIDEPTGPPPVGSTETARQFINDAQAAVDRADSLGAVLAIIAAAKELEPGRN